MIQLSIQSVPRSPMDIHSPELTCPALYHEESNKYSVQLNFNIADT